MITQFESIYRIGMQQIGKFRVAASGIAWKCVEGDQQQVIAVKAADIKWAKWLRVARNFQLQVGLIGHKKETFDGFLRDDHQRLESLLKTHFHIPLQTIEVSLKGWNWGSTDFQGQELAFTHPNKTAFILDLQRVNNTNIAAKAEVALEFMPSTAKFKDAPDELTEIRFFIPGTHPKLNSMDIGSQNPNTEDDAEEQSAAQVFHSLVKQYAGVAQVSDDVILSFDEVLILTPRGRYDVDMYKNFFRLHYKIFYSSISRLFLLPRDDQHVLFILGLNNPVRQGQTQYPYLVMQFTRDEEVTAELNISDNDLESYDGLKKMYEDLAFEVVSSLFRSLSGRKIAGPGSYRSRSGLPGVKANLRATQGDLFLLERCLFFVSKQPMLIELADIHQVFLSRTSNVARTFDMRIITKNGPEYTFTSINKEEQESVHGYLKDKEIKMDHEQIPDAELLLAAEDGDDDESMQSADSDRGQRQADDDSESDVSFQASSSDGDSPTDSSTSGSEAETASDTSGDFEFAKKMKNVEGQGKAQDMGRDKKPIRRKEINSKGDRVDSPSQMQRKKQDEDVMDVDEDMPKMKDAGVKLAERRTGADESRPPRKKQKTTAN